MGVVYLAEDILLDRQVVIKTLTPLPGKQHIRARLLREAQSVSNLSHPNIAVVHDYGETPDGQPYFVMEFVRGKTLKELIDEGALTLRRAVEIVEGIAGALTEAHRRNIIHRDIKPSNVAVNERGEVKVLDFGLAKRVEGEEASPDGEKDAAALLATQTREGMFVGTPTYVSPEQALGLPLDGRSDIYSLGGALYECLTGRPAFNGISVADMCAKVIRDDPPPPSRGNPDVLPELDRITLKALAKAPEQRYQSAEELLTDLRRLRDALPDVKEARIPRRKTPAARTYRTSTLNALLVALARPRILTAGSLRGTTFTMEGDALSLGCDV